MELNTKQREAVNLCLNRDKRLVAVTGLAGTGKTTIIQTVTRSFLEAGYRVAIAAPAGKAANRIKELTGYGAQTIHLMLSYTMPGEIDEETGKFCTLSYPRRNRQRPLDYDVVLVDEYSMTNWELHSNLMDAIKSGAVVRVFGDINQLPPIEGENVSSSDSPFAYILKRFPSVTLDEIVRQEGTSSIIINAARIVAGHMPRQADDFDIRYSVEPIKELHTVIRQQQKLGVDYSTPNNQVIIPMRRSWLGTDKVNTQLQYMFGKSIGKGIRIPVEKWEETQEICIYPEDKIIWTRNDYTLGIFNGESGIVQSITPEGTITIDFGNRVIEVHAIAYKQILNSKAKNSGGSIAECFTKVPYDPRKYISLAYALTTHKVQGSEMDNIIYIINKASSIMLCRANLITAITRARKHVTIITDHTSLANSVRKVTQGVKK